MLVAHYIGPAKAGAMAKLGHWLTVKGQKGPYDQCTHTEAIHQEHDDGTVTIASSSLTDKGVRRKRVKLNMQNWIITDVPGWDVAVSVRHFDTWIKWGMDYDKWGALATMLPGHQDSGKLFCTESVLYPFVKAPHYFTPAQGLAICLSIGFNCTDHYKTKWGQA